MYDKSKTLPAWIEAFRRSGANSGVVYGPPLGPVVSDLLERFVIPARIDPLEYLYDMMTQQSTLALPNGLGPAVAAMVRVIPGHVGLCKHTRMGAVVPASTLFRYGPSPGAADIVVVGKHPTEDEDRTGMLFSGASGRELRDAMLEGGVADFLDNAYFTNICWFNPPKGNFKKTFTKEFAWFLWAELMTIRPRLVLILGSDAIKHFYGNRLNVTNSRGQLMDLPMAPVGDDGDPVVFKAFATMHPAAVARENTMRTGLAADLKRVKQWFVSGREDTDRPRYADHWEDYVLDTVNKVRDYVDARIHDCTTLFAVDCEWEGRSPFAGGKLLTIQISHAEGESVLVPVHRHPRLPESFVTLSADGAVYADGSARMLPPSVANALIHQLEICAGERQPFDKREVMAVKRGDVYEVTSHLVKAFSLSEWSVVLELLRRLFLRPEIRVGGHNFKSDLHWLKSVGLDLTEPFRRGFDTMLQHHLIYESGQHGLEVCALKYTSLGRYDFAIGEYLRDNEGTGMGFGHVPESILYPYALYDPDASMRIHKVLNAELDAMPARDRDALRTTLASDMAANIAIIEMEETGLMADRSRILELADCYSRKFEQILAELRSQIAWPTFNPRSVIQCRELLFGESYSGKVDKFGNPIRLRPPGADCRNLMPIKTTGRPARDWATIVAAGQENEFSPSTDKETLGILGVNDPVAATLRSLRFVDQVVKLYVSLPQTDPDTGEVTEGGLLQYIDPDGRIRTTLLQLAETGRWMSRAPNCQNLPSRREPQLHKYFDGEQKPYRLRSVFKAPPEHVLIEADYSSAELIVIGLASGDMDFYHAVTGKHRFKTVSAGDNVLFWLHPEYFRTDRNVAVGDCVPAGSCIGQYRTNGAWRDLVVRVDAAIVEKSWARDLHGEQAIASFRLPYDPVIHGPPKGFVESTAADKRVAAKSVNFGIPYGRSANAVARELQQEGISITAEETQAIIDNVLKTYGLVALFLDNCKRVMREDGVLWTIHGRRRRFATNVEEHILVEQERESGNFPIQGEVACCLDRAVANLKKVRETLQAAGRAINYLLSLAIHDAVMLQAHVSCVEPLMVEGGIIDYCMRYEPSVRIPMPDRAICGGLYANANPQLFPYALPIDKKIALRWGETPSADALRAVGVSESVITRHIKG